MNRYEQNKLIIQRNEIKGRIVQYKVEKNMEEGNSEMAAVRKLSFKDTVIYWIHKLKI